MAFCDFLYNENLNLDNYSPRALPGGETAFVDARQVLNGRDWSCPPASTRIDIVAAAGQCAVI